MSTESKPKKWVRVGRWQDGMKGTHNYQTGLTVSNGERTVKVTGDCANNEEQYRRLYNGHEEELPRLDALLTWQDAKDVER